HGLEWEGLNIILLSISAKTNTDERFAFLTELTKLTITQSQGIVISSDVPGSVNDIFQQFSKCRKKILEFQLNSSFAIDNASFIGEIASLVYKINQNVIDSDLENSKRNTEQLFDILEKTALELEKSKILFLRILNIINTEKRMRKETSLPSQDFKLMKCQDRFQLNREFQAVIVRIIESDLDENETSRKPWLIEKTKQEIHNHYKDNSLTLRKFCSTIVFTNPDYLGKIFHQYEKKSFHTYLNSVRISAAKELIIQNPHIAMYEVSRQSGFGENSQYFSKVFKQVEKISPSQYRERIRKGILT
ncbi:MAG: helix-turn-helix domain-containing protein, partial [Spirochaetales bacterium]|nr:helix-turn-helix domain-containing protein [Spirochaetales bacterium]